MVVSKLILKNSARWGNYFSTVLPSFELQAKNCANEIVVEFIVHIKQRIHVHTIFNNFHRLYT
jgi:hypothetical protein